jgi:hypothetical protein
VFDRLHHVQLAMPRGQESAAPAFFVDVLDMAEVDKPPFSRRVAVRGFALVTWSCLSASRTTSGPPARRILGSSSMISMRSSSAWPCRLGLGVSACVV